MLSDLSADPLPCFWKPNLEAWWKRAGKWHRSTLSPASGKTPWPAFLNSWSPVVRSDWKRRYLWFDINFSADAKQFEEEIKENFRGGSPIVAISFCNDPSERFGKHGKCLTSMRNGMMQYLSLVRDSQPAFGKTFQANFGRKLLRDAAKENASRFNDIWAVVVFCIGRENKTEHFW